MLIIEAPDLDIINLVFKGQFLFLKDILTEQQSFKCPNIICVIEKTIFPV